MFADFALLQPFWIFLLPVPWLWLYWRKSHFTAWPQIMPTLIMRYPLLGDLFATQDEDKITSSKAKSRLLSSDKYMAIALSFIVFSLAQPVHYSGYIEQQELSQPVDLIFVIDTGISMVLKDYKIKGQRISRMDMTKLLLKSFIKDYSGSRMGLVIFGKPPALWLPLSDDKVVIQDAVNRLSTLLGGRMTDMGAALKLVQEQFKENSQSQLKSKQEKVIVLISDGSTQLGAISPLSIAKELADEGFSLYIIAVGSADSQLTPVNNKGLIYQATNITMLQHVVDRGTGKLFHALNSSAFQNALVDIEQNHRQLIESKNQQRLSQAWYPFPLFIALLLLLYAVLRPQEPSL